MDRITVIKRNPEGEETWRYQARLLQHQGDQIVLEAFFDRQDSWIDGMLLARGDRFIETYYTNRWYNIFEIHARDSGHLRGWYCNIGHPAEVEGNTLSYIDLALDLLVFPDGSQIVLDEEEFQKLEISPDTRRMALGALDELQAGFQEKIKRLNSKLMLK